MSEQQEADERMLDNLDGFFMRQVERIADDLMKLGARVRSDGHMADTKRIHRAAMVLRDLQNGWANLDMGLLITAAHDADTEIAANGSEGGAA